MASHYLLWEKCVHSGDTILICEDDIQVTEKFGEACTLAERLAKRYGLIRLYGIFDRPYRRIKMPHSDRTLVRYWRGPSGAHAYVVTPKAAHALIKNKPIWDEPADDYLDRFWDHGIQLYGLLPFEVSRNNFGSMTSCGLVNTKEIRTARAWRRRKDRIQRILGNLKWRFVSREERFEQQ